MNIWTSSSLSKNAIGFLPSRFNRQYQSLENFGCFRPVHTGAVPHAGKNTTVHTNTCKDWRWSRTKERNTYSRSWHTDNSPIFITDSYTFRLTCRICPDEGSTRGSARKWWFQTGYPYHLSPPSLRGWVLFEPLEEKPTPLCRFRTCNLPLERRNP